MCGIDTILLDDLKPLDSRTVHTRFFIVKIGTVGAKRLLILNYNGKGNLLGKYLAILSIWSSL